MAQLTVQKTSLTGLSPVYTAAASGGDKFKNDGQTVLYVKNDDVASHTVTIDSIRKCDFGFDHDVQVTVSAGTTQAIGVFPVSRFNDGLGDVSISYDAVTSVSVAVVTQKQ